MFILSCYLNLLYVLTHGKHNLLYVLTLEEFLSTIQKVLCTLNNWVSSSFCSLNGIVLLLPLDYLFKKKKSKFSENGRNFLGIKLPPVKFYWMGFQYLGCKSHPEFQAMVYEFFFLSFFAKYEIH